MIFYDDKPIIACSTGTLSNTAIGLIRLSGFKSLSDLKEFFSTDISNLKPRYAHYTNILSGAVVLDSIVVTYFKGPNSYNGENILELGVHGNQINISRIIRLFIDSGKFRAAHEGEFTYRALLNKKLTLAQVEGLDLLLNANSGLMLQQGLSTLQGALFEEYTKLYDLYMKLKSAIEINIDFAEDVGEDESAAFLKRSFNSFFTLIKSLHNRTIGNVNSLQSPEIVLVGQTNAGKSSLFNLLLDNNRSIVSNIAGTTRDYVSEYVFIDDVNYKLVDTAGIRETEDYVEKIGIDRTFEVLRRAFFKILVINPLETDYNEFNKLPSDIVFDYLFITHADAEKIDYKAVLTKIPKFKKGVFCSLNSSGPIEPEYFFGPIEPQNDVDNNGPMGPVEKVGPIEPASVFGPIEPVIALKSDISYKFKDLTVSNPILLDRHRESIKDIYSKSVYFQELMSEVDDIAILSSEMNVLGVSVAQLIGIIRPEDVLNNIFSNFCIGK
ncbi:ferrous iron transport protein B-like protein [Bacteriovorax sp. BSW11_IV]|uniref:tRNA modification GTPase n=1 Tax=Bacteriovorax sp. BSW11_IV TaxID=1353529 RepID=UPI00038A4D39|nr:GTPase [Bacteriovorax sp. BSW11_IV]EQC50029.1 ferrous iron transport protein B-like protein [Bacteriovorax sp. BSW11_IV]